MMYPHDPLGPVGPEYPNGFRMWYFAIVMMLIVGAIFMTGCKDVPQDVAKRCDSYPDRQARLQCYHDIEWMLEELK